MTFHRHRVVDRLAEEEFDVLVVGGGITGAGVALDAASRGFKTALIEAEDFASGTSSKSSKLVHGGLRYLQQRDVRLVYEALAERHRLLKNAPHLVHVLPFLLPMYHRDGLVPKKVARALGGAMWGYDLTGGMRIGKRHQKLDTAETLRMMPRLDPERVAWSYLYFDAEADDARLTLAVLRTAALDFDAAVANRVAMVGFAEGADSARTVTAQTAEGDRFEIRAGCIVNATGVWADTVSGMDPSGAPISLRPAKGVHLTFDSRHFENQIAAIVPVPGDRRSMFVIPWGGQTYVGTTDTSFEGDLRNPTTTAADVDYLLSALNKATTSRLEPSDVQGTWAGLRPLVADSSSDRTADLSRRHRVSTSTAGVITVTGGKLTTYRDMAKDAVDAVVEYLQPAPALRSCRTANLALRGADGYEETGAMSAKSAPVGAATLAHLARRFGGEAGVVLALVDQDPNLAQPMVEGLPYLRAEAVYAARYEMATTLDDVVSRRTRARLRHAPATAAAAPAIARLIGDELGWDEQRVSAEAADVVERCTEDLAGARDLAGTTSAAPGGTDT